MSILADKYNMPRQTRAFTFVELIFVVIILGIIFAVGAKIFSLDTFTSSNYYYETLNSIRYAEKVALSSGCDTQVSITSNSLQLLMRANCTTGSFSLGVTDPVARQNQYLRPAPSGTTISSSDLPIYFDKQMYARSSSNGNIVNAVVTVDGKSINIIGQTGFVYEP